jgi:hypothetical protein
MTITLIPELKTGKLKQATKGVNAFSAGGYGRVDGSGLADSSRLLVSGTPS